jgi:hypothetical protein
MRNWNDELPALTAKRSEQTPRTRIGNPDPKESHSLDERPTSRAWLTPSDKAPLKLPLRLPACQSIPENSVISKIGLKREGKAS